MVTLIERIFFFFHSNSVLTLEFFCSSKLKSNLYGPVFRQGEGNYHSRSRVSDEGLVTSSSTECVSIFVREKEKKEERRRRT